MQFSKITITPFTQSELWCEEHEGELQHLSCQPAQSPDLNIIEPLWSVLEISMRNRFRPQTSLKQHEGVLQEEWYKIPLETAQNESIPRTILSILETEVVQHHDNKELCTVFVVFPLFCPTPVCEELKRCKCHCFFFSEN
jgi:hypothetical protein